MIYVTEFAKTKRSNFLKKVLTAFKLTAIAIVTIYFAIKTIIILKLTKNPKTFYKDSKVWPSILLKISGIKLNVEGTENIDKNENYVFVANHSSLYDIPVVMLGIPNKIKIIYKEELEKIPIFGTGLKVSPFIRVKRSDPQNAMKSIEAAIQSVQGDTSVLVFPEGTRSEDGEIQEFKRGAFMLATRSNKPIVPITIIGTTQILPSKSKVINSGNVRLIIGKPIFIENELNRQEEKSLMQSVRNIIIENSKKV